MHNITTQLLQQQVLQQHNSYNNRHITTHVITGILQQRTRNNNTHIIRTNIL